MNQMFKKASSVFTAIVCAASITFSGASLVLADGEIDEQYKDNDRNNCRRTDQYDHSADRR